MICPVWANIMPFQARGMPTEANDMPLMGKQYAVLSKRSADEVKLYAVSGGRGTNKTTVAEVPRGKFQDTRPECRCLGGVLLLYRRFQNLILRLIAQQHNAITNPAHTLIIFNIDSFCLEAYDTATQKWWTISCPPGGAPPPSPPQTSP